ncbi:MAG: nucleoside hydrolase [Cyclobacteriaceae bacterium]
MVILTFQVIVINLGIIAGLLLFPHFNLAQSSPVKVIFDTDMGSDCDDVGALALLHAYANEGQAEIIGCVFSSGKVPYGAGIVEAINIYYGRPDIPVGAYQRDDIGDPMDKMQAQKLARDTVAFHNTIVHNQDAKDLTKLCRRLLTEQEDSSVVYVTVGHTKGLYDVLTSDPDEVSPLSGRELVSQKVSHWVALGALKADNPEGEYKKDWNFFFNSTAPFTQHLIEKFPSEVVLINAGTNVLTGKSLVDTPAGNIVRTAYRDWLWNVFEHTLIDQRPSWDLAAVYYAIEGEGDFMEKQPPGWLEFDSEKGCLWHSGSSDLRHTLITQKSGSDEAFADYLNRMIAFPPLRTHP